MNIGHFVVLMSSIAAVCGRSALADSLKGVSPDERSRYIRAAQVWHPTDIPHMDLWKGPEDVGRLEFEQEVRCDYVPKKLDGTTSKFQCHDKEGRKYKVRYDPANGNIYAMPAASRLFWALGFGAVRSWPARVFCHNCPEDPFASPFDQDDYADRLFHPAVVDVKMQGDKIIEDGKNKGGWAWNELDQIDPKYGGAPRAQRDALKLLAAFVQHGDNNPGQQELICLPGGVRYENGRPTCKKPLMFVKDLGSTFGGSEMLDERASMNLDAWRNHPIWSDARHCVADLAATPGSSLSYPKISEAGRSFLTHLLSQLTDRQIVDLFRVGRADQRDQNEHDVPTVQRRKIAPIFEWVRVFKNKREQIIRAHCPD
jgi:hypothetical protein